MRTTLTVEPDVARLLRHEVRRSGQPLERIINEALRRGLRPLASLRPARRYRVKPHQARLRAGLDPRALNRLVDELEDAALVAKLSR